VTCKFSLLGLSAAAVGVDTADGVDTGGGAEDMVMVGGGPMEEADTTEDVATGVTTIGGGKHAFPPTFLLAPSALDSLISSAAALGY
jgi:hypothetical protein